MTKQNENMKEVMENEVGEFEALGVIDRNDIVSSDDGMNLLLNPSSDFLCTIVNDGTRESKVKIYNAINATDKKLADHIGEVIEIVDVVAHPVELTHEVTGEVVKTVRTVLIDKDGVSYTAVSGGILNSLQKLFMIFGQPHWDEPVKVKVKQVGTRNGNNKINTLEAVL